MQGRLLRFVLLVVVPVLALLVAAAFWLTGGRYITTENAYVRADIVQIAPEVAGRVTEVLVRDHARVSAGAVLLRLDPTPFRLALEKAEAELDSARTQVELSRATFQETQGEMAELEKRVAFLLRQARRQEELASRGIAPTARMEETQHDAQVAQDRMNVLRQRLVRLLTTLKGDPALPVDDHPQVREKVAERDRAALDLARTEIKAPTGGTVVNLRLWVDANLKETTLTHVAVGQRVDVVLDIYPNVTWKGVVESISPATGAEFAILPPQNASGNWVKVVQRLPVRIRLEPHAGEPPLRAGVTATVSIDTGRGRSIADVVSGFFDLFRGGASREHAARTP